jgi:hypothetical protein
MRKRNTLRVILCAVFLGPGLCAWASPAAELPAPAAPEAPRKGPVRLTADAKRDAYAVIREQGYEVEVPDDIHGGIQHISQQFDPVLGKDVFAFTLHRSPDNDPTGPQRTDRQRNEMKSYDRSPDYLTGTRGEIHSFRWKFKVPAGFIGSAQFTHIHQLKAVGGDDSAPVITLTCRKKSSGGEFMQLIYRGPEAPDGTASKNIYLAEVPLADFTGEWVEAEERVLYDDPPEYSIKVARIRDGAALLEYAYDAANYAFADPFITIRESNTFVRPKWGIYRQITSGNKPIEGLRDETFLFADFEQNEETR